ncbi:MAG: B-box zinc finger protein [Promethearchaeota archaeon]
MSLKCAYHPEREASAKCEKCGKVICLECKIVNHKTIHGGSKDHSYAYNRSYEVCTICYYDRKTNTYGNRAKIIGGITIVFLIIYIAFDLTMFNLIGIPGVPSIFYIFDIIFLLVPIVIIVVIIYLMFIYGPKKVEEFKSKKEDFLNSITTKA